MRSRRRQDGGSAFIVGLLSLLDVLLEMPMDAILAKLELSQDVDDALLDRKGPLAPPLQLVEAYERADWDAAQSLAADADIAPDALPDLYIDALQWATQRISGDELDSRGPRGLRRGPRGPRGPRGSRRSR
jgi:c-di-GMP-related signal transduction protein